MNARYFVMIDGEESPRGPLPVGAVRRLIDAGDIMGGTPVCQEGDTDWLTLDDYWSDIMPPVAAPVRAVASGYAGAAVHPALVSAPLPIWKIVFGVLCFIWAAGGFVWGLSFLAAGQVVWAICLGLGGAFWMFVGLRLTKKK